MNRQKLEEEGWSQALQKELHMEGSVCCLSLSVCEARVRTRSSIFPTKVSQITKQESRMTGPGGKLSIDWIMLAQQEEVIGECLFSCTSAFLQDRGAGTLAMAQPQSLLMFKLHHLCFKDRGEHTQTVFPG